MYTKSASPEFLTKLLQSVGIGGGTTQPPAHVPKKPDFNPTGLEDMGVGAGAGILAGGATAAVPGGLALLKEKRLSQIPGDMKVQTEGLAHAIFDTFKGGDGAGDPKMKALILSRLMKDHKSTMAGLTDETSELQKAIPGLIKYRNLALKLGIPIGAGAGALAGLGYYNSRPAE